LTNDQTSRVFTIDASAFGGIKFVPANQMPKFEVRLVDRIEDTAVVVDSVKYASVDDIPQDVFDRAMVVTRRTGIITGIVGEKK